jgi:hypothetical protein
MTAKYLKVEVMGQPVFILFNPNTLKHSDVANDLRIAACVKSAGLIGLLCDSVKTGAGSPSMGLPVNEADAKAFQKILI